MHSPFNYVSIIIPTFEDWPRLKLGLIALSKQTYPIDFFEIIVVNNKPQDQIPEDFVNIKNCLFIGEHRPGSYAARNAALKVSKGTIIGFTDSDCIPDKDWIWNSVERLKKENLCRIGGQIKVFSNKKSPNIYEVYDLVFAFPQKGYVEDMSWAVTANMFVKRDLFNKIGFFNENLQSGGDYEWGQRAKKSGYSIEYVEDSIVKHPARDSVLELLKKARRVSRGVSEMDFYNGNISNPKISRQLYIIFRWRTNELAYIKAKILELNLSHRYIYIVCILFLRNLVLGFGDFHRYKRIRELRNKI